MSKKNEIMALATQELPQLKAILKLNSMPGTDVETMARQELQYLEQIGVTLPVIYECLPITIVSAVKQVLKQNLTLDPYAGLVYVKTRNINIGTQQSPQWEKGLEIQPSANGLISIARQTGRVLDIERPEVIKDEKGKVISVKFKYQTPGFDDKGLRCTRWKEVEFDESDFYRWQRASHNENGRNKQDADKEKLNYANPNYTNWKGGIDPEFARSKAIRHGLKKLGTNQNESRAVQIVTQTEKKIIIDKDADIAAMEDDNNNSDYIPHEDVPVNKVGVTTYEEMEIPANL